MCASHLTCASICFPIFVVVSETFDHTPFEHSHDASQMLRVFEMHFDDDRAIWRGLGKCFSYHDVCPAAVLNRTQYVFVFGHQLRSGNVH